MPPLEKEKWIPLGKNSTPVEHTSGQEQKKNKTSTNGSKEKCGEKTLLAKVALTPGGGVCGCAVCGCVVCVVWVAHISIVKTKKLRFFRI